MTDRGLIFLPGVVVVLAVLVTMVRQCRLEKAVLPFTFGFLMPMAVAVFTVVVRDAGNHHSSVNACINNLRQIDGAKEQWALEKKKTAGEASVDAEVAGYIKGGMPRCSKGGGYSIGPVGTNPTCSIPGHSL